MNEKDRITFNSLPIVKNEAVRTIGQDLIPVLPKTQEELVKGRKIIPFPNKYNHFDSYDALEEYIRNELLLRTKFKSEWIEVATVIIMSLDLRPDVYFSSVNAISITCREPGVKYGDDILSIELTTDWDMERIKKIVNKIQKLH